MTDLLISPLSKRAGPNKALACCAKAAAWRGYDVAVLQDVSKHIPGRSAWEAHPYIGSILTAIHLEAHVQEGLTQDAGILLVEAHQVQHGIVAVILQANWATWSHFCNADAKKLQHARDNDRGTARC